jgi:hypothetical protein
VGVIGARFALYPQPQRTEAEWANWWRDYLNALAGLPADVVEEAMQTWVAKPDSQFLPRPGELRALALVIRDRLARRQELALAGPVLAAPRQALPVERAKAREVRRLAAELRKPGLEGKTFPAKVWRDLAEQQEG